MSQSPKDFARKLHDRAAQDLAYLNLKLEKLSSDQSCPQLKAELLQCRAVAEGTLKDIRRMIAAMRGDAAVTSPISLSQLLGQMEDHYRLCIACNGLENFEAASAELQQNVLLCLNEAFINVARHAQTQNVVVCFEGEDGMLLVRVEDDGIGFNPHCVKATSFGLRIMRERADEMTAKLSIFSKKGQGTKVCLSVPYEQKRIEEQNEQTVYNPHRG